MKKFALILVCLLMFLACIAVAEEMPTVYTSGDYEYTLLNDGTAEIIKYSGFPEEVTIPRKLDHYVVTSIGEQSFDNSWFEKITIPDSVTSIGNGAFLGCKYLKEIIIPDSVTSIGEYAFSNCWQLTNITIPNGVTTIGKCTFDGCSSLTEIIIPDSVTSIGESAFYYCKSLTEIILPDSVTSIGFYAFGACDSLTKIIIPDSVTFIGEWAFYYCKSLTEIILPDGITSIGDKAFFGCNSLTEIILPDSVTSIGDEAFLGCISLTEINIPSSVTFIGDKALYECNSITLAVEKDSYAEQYAKNHNIEYTIPDSWEYVLLADGTAEITSYIGTQREMVIPTEMDGCLVTSIGDYAFKGCVFLIEITIPDSVISIGCNPFINCPNFSQINVSTSHSSLATIDGVLFDKNEKKLICYPWAFAAKSYSIPNGISSIGDCAFYGCFHLTEIIIPDSVISIEGNPFRCSYGLTTLKISPENPSLATIDGVLFDKNEKKLICYPYAFEATSYSIPNGISSIGDSAFYDCYRLTEIIIPESVVFIGDEAFNGCDSLTLTVERDSHAAQYAKDNNIHYTYTDATDWLNS